MPAKLQTILYNFPGNLKIIKEQVYDKCDFVSANPKFNPESTEYGACSFELNGKVIQHRISKITPVKTGQFVTIWKRHKNGIAEPYDISDHLDFIIITSKNSDKLGQFIFPKSALCDNGIITQKGKEEKRGIRVYLPWDIVNNMQAEKTQSWQINYFLPVYPGKTTDLNLALKLFI